MATTNNDTESVSTNADSENESMENELQKSSFDLENPETVTDGDEVKGGQWMNLAFLPLLLLFIALQFSCLLSEHLVDGDNGMPASVSLVVSMVLGIGAMVILFQQIWSGKVHLRNDRRQNVQVNTILRDNLSLVGIIFFCPFACFLNIFKIFTQVSCGESWRTIDEYQFYITDVAFCVLHTVFMTMELLFCVQFRRLVLKKNVSKIRKFCVKLSLTIVVAANIGLWFNVILHEITKFTTEESIKILGNDSVHSYETCLLRTFSSLEETVRRTLYPFSVEFSLLVLEFIASHLIFYRRHKDHEMEDDQSIAISSENLQEENLRRASLKSISGNDRNVFFSMTSPLVIIFGVFSNLLFLAFAFFSKEEIFDHHVLRKTVLYNQYFIIFYWFLVILLMTIGFASARKFKAGKNELKGIDYVVVVSAFGPFICFLIRIIVVIENIQVVKQHYDPVIIWLPEVLNLIEVMLQLPFMFFADCIQCSSEEEARKPSWRIFKATVLSVALCNITLWLLNSILENLDIVASIFPHSQFTLIDVIFRPFAIFFRFNGFLILLRAFLR